MKILGIDPGHTGALALLTMRITSLARPELRVLDMPILKVGGKSRAQVNEAELVRIIRELRPEHVVIENVHSMPEQGVASTFAFGLAYGVVRGVVVGLGLPMTPIEPQKWVALVQRGPGKDASCQRATQLFPENSHDFAFKSKHGRADAALIALAGFRTLSPF